MCRRLENKCQNNSHKNGTFFIIETNEQVTRIAGRSAMQGTKTRHGYSRSVLCNIREITKPGYTSKICDRALMEVEYWHNLPFSSLPVFLTVPFCEASQTGPRRRLCMAQSRGASKSLPLLAFVFLSPEYIKDTILRVFVGNQVDRNGGKDWE